MIKGSLLTNSYEFEITEKTRIGTLRCYYDGYRMNSSWFPTEIYKESVLKRGMRVMLELQKIIERLIDNELSNFDKVVKLCEAEGYSNEKNYFFDTDNLNYWVRLVPVRGDYNIYVKAYLKEMVKGA